MHIKKEAHHKRKGKKKSDGTDEQNETTPKRRTTPSRTVISPTTRPSGLSGSSALGTMEISVHAIREAISGSNPRVPLVSALTRSTRDCLSAWDAFPRMVEASVYCCPVSILAVRGLVDGDMG